MNRKIDALDTILIMGAEGSGKTCLWHWLRFGKGLETVTSMAVNDETFALHSEVKDKQPGRPVHIVDLPGNSRLINAAKEYFPVTRGIIYMVDATAFKDQVRGIADQLYMVLTSEKLIANRCEVFVACNKSDLPTAKDKDLIKRVLEKEMNALCRSKAAAPAADKAANGDEERMLVDEDEEFDFDKAPLQLYFVETTLTSIPDKVRKFEGFIRSLVK